MHIFDAGICFIDKVITDNPTFCFLDWFSTGFINSSDYIKQYIDTIVLKLVLNKCVPIFLLFDRKYMNQTRLAMYNYVIDYANKHNIKFVSIINNKNIDELLRDNVHTTEVGSEFYGNTIYNYFMESIMNSDISDIILPVRNKYFNVKALSINSAVYDKLIIYGSGEIVGIYQKIGPYSGIIDIIDSEEFVTKYNIWNMWCHYERNNIKS